MLNLGDLAIRHWEALLGGAVQLLHTNWRIDQLHLQYSTVQYHSGWSVGQGAWPFTQSNWFSYSFNTKLRIFEKISAELSPPTSGHPVKMFTR